MALFATKDAKLECAPNHHLIDRRQLVVEKDPTDPRRELKDRQNQVCVCGKLNAHAAEYRGGEFTYVYLDGGPEQKIRQMMQTGEASASDPRAEERRD